MLVGVPRRRVPRPWVPATRFPRGRRVRIVHRPGRQQVQLGIAALGTHRRDPERLPLLVAETAFGGTFASELTHEIRSVRGWSYYAGSTLRAGGKRDLLELWAHPATEVAAACAPSGSFEPAPFGSADEAAEFLTTVLFDGLLAPTAPAPSPDA